MKTNSKKSLIAFTVLAICTMLFIAYMVSPIDLIPALTTAFIGLIDDLIALVGAIGTAVGAVTALVCAIKGQKKQDIVVAC